MRTRGGGYASDRPINPDFAVPESMRSIRVTAHGPRMIEVITEAYHRSQCNAPDTCPAKCPHRMPVTAATAVHKAVLARISQVLDEIEANPW